MKLQTQLNVPGAETIARVLEAAVNNVDPYRLVDRNILLLNDTLCLEGKRYPGQKFIILVAMGKASLAMTQAAVDKLGARISRGICICKTMPQLPPTWDNIEIIQGAHPVPDERSLHAGQAIREMLSGLTEDDLLLVLVSGGSSALVVDPCEGIGLDDLQAMNRALLHCGATINEMNCVRKHAERLKGGGLVKLANPAKVAALLLSDVIGDDMSVIASGPTVADPTTFANALKIVNKYGITEQMPVSILTHLEKGSRGQATETLKPGNAANRNVTNTLIGSNHHAIQAAMEIAQQEGFDCRCVSEQMTGEASAAAEWFLNQALDCGQMERPAMYIAGGETTVTVRGNGKGGRNLQVALSVVGRMSNLQNAVFVTLATDGEDGPTDAAGAVVTPETKPKALALGLDPAVYLENNDAYTFFEKVDGLIKTGSTGTNVNDLTLLFQFQPKC
jgi:glycerate 2-kinase